MLEKWDCHRMDYNSHNRQHLHLDHDHHSRNQSFSSVLLDAICKSTEVEGGMMAYKRSSNRQEMRNVEAKKNTAMRSSRIEWQWDEDSWENNEKLMRGRDDRMSVFNAGKNESEAANRKHRESQPSFQSNISSAALCSSDYGSNTSSISCPYLYPEAESLYTHNSYIPTAKIESHCHHVGCDDRTCKWVLGGESSRDLQGKSLVRDVDFRSMEKPFNHADHHVKIKSKSNTDNYSKKPSQPISPGRKLANFLSWLFIAGGTKKPKFSSSPSVSDSNSCDSYEGKPASSYSSSSSVQSRPCLSKPSRGSNNTSGMNQMPVTFCSTSVIVEKADSRPSGEKCLHRKQNPAPNPNLCCYPHTHPSKGAYKLPQLEKDNHTAVVAAKNIIGKYWTANGIMDAVSRTLDKQDEMEEDDVTSCSSSDLFELENLADTDYSIYQRELPVYGTTHWETNKAIAKGLIV